MVMKLDEKKGVCGIIDYSWNNNSWRIHSDCIPDARMQECDMLNTKQHCLEEIHRFDVV